MSASREQTTLHRPLNVLRVITWLPVGGIERRLLAVLPRLNPERYRCRVVCIRERGPLASDFEEQGIPVDVVPFASRLSPSGLRALARYMREHEIDIVHSHMYRSNTPATIAARMAGVPVVISQVHNMDTWESSRQRLMDRFLCRWRTAILAVSEHVREDVIRNLKVPEEMVRVVYNGVDISHFKDGAKRQATRAALGLSPEQCVIVYHGRLVPQKNPQALIKIAYDAKRYHPNSMVLVVGDGSLRQQLEQDARDYGASNYIRFLGRRADISDLLHAGDISVLPSFKEGFSNAIIEAMASGLPVIASDVGGNAEAVVQGRTGFIVPPGDDMALLDAVNRLVDDPPAIRRMSEQARMRAERFSLDRMVDHIEGLYSLLARQAGLL